MRYAFLLIVLLYFSVPFHFVIASQPNVIIVMTDDQGYGELSVHGNPVVATPHLDRLHSESIRFTNFHVAPMCTPTRGQLMTGVDCLRNRAMNVSSGRTLLRQDLPTMPEFFAQAGYATGMFGKWHLGDNYPYRPQDRGFQEAIWYPSSHIGSIPDYWNNDYFDDTYWHKDRRRPFTGYTTDVFFDEAMRWMQNEAESEKPFFCYLATAAAHWPHFVPEKYLETVKQRAKDLNFPHLDKEQLQEFLCYLAMIENIDENMGRLEVFLEKTNLRNNTILIFLTDNGSTFGPRYFNAGMRGGKVSLWEGGHRVPCFVRWPDGRLRAPTDVQDLCEVQDLLPTLLDLVAIRPTETAYFDGISLVDTLKDSNEPPPDRVLVVQFSRMNGPAPKRGDACVMWQNWRLIQEKELYDLSVDPAQEQNIIDEHPAIVDRLKERYGKWWDGVSPGLNVPLRIVIGDKSEPASLISSCEWWNVFFDQSVQVRRGEARNSVCYLEVARAGEYELELRRWPRECNVPLSAAVPAEKVTAGSFPEGKGLPIAKARCRIAEQDQTIDLGVSDTKAVFRATLSKGPIELRTWFLDQHDKELCGAYYVYIRYLEH